MVSLGDNTNNDKNKDNKEDLSWSCWEETIKGIANVLSHLRGTWYSTDPTIQGSYQWERQQLEKYVTPFQLGAGAAIFLFVNFRITGHPRFQAWRNPRNAATPQHHGQPSPHPNNKISTNYGGRETPSHGYSTHRSTGRPIPQVPKGYLEAKRETEIKTALSSMRFITDVLVSGSVGVSGTLFLLQAHKETLRRDFEQAPLVAGQSLVAEEMCDPFLKLFQETKNSPTYDRKEDGKDLNMTTFSKFATNCQLRRNMEQQIREQKGISEKDPVRIPLYSGLERYRGIR